LAHELTHVVQQNGNKVQAKTDSQVATKGNKLQTKERLVSGFPAQLKIQRRENPQEQAEKENKPQPAQPTPAPAPATPQVANEGGSAAAAPEMVESGDATAAPEMAAGGSTAETQTAASGGAAPGAGGTATSPASPEADPGFQAVVSQVEGVDQNLMTKAVRVPSEGTNNRLMTNSFDDTLIAYGTRVEQTFDGGRARLNCFGQSNRKMTTVWRLTSNNNQEDRLTDVSLYFRFSNHQQATVEPEIPTPSQVVRGSLSVEFSRLNGLTLSGQRQGTVIMNGTARSLADVKRIPDLEATCELYDADRIPDSGKLAITQASVEGKLFTYSLNPDHRKGRHKARVFLSVLGFSRLNIDELARQLVFDPVRATPTQRNEYGQLYRQIIGVNGANGRTANVVTGWILRNDDQSIRLTTAFVEGS
jgi:hypothetical protein